MSTRAAVPFVLNAGGEGLRMDHPAQLHVGLRRRDRLLAEEFCAERALVLAERSLPGPALADPSRDGASSALPPTVPEPSPSDEGRESETLPWSTDTFPEAGL